MASRSQRPPDARRTSHAPRPVDMPALVSKFWANVWLIGWGVSSVIALSFLIWIGVPKPAEKEASNTASKDVDALVAPALASGKTVAELTEIEKQQLLAKKGADALLAKQGASTVGLLGSSQPKGSLPALAALYAAKPYANSIGMKFVWIPPGTFFMGSPAGETSRFDNETQHKVTLTKGFYMSVIPVTQEQWQAVMGDNPSRFKGDESLVNSEWSGREELGPLTFRFQDRGQVLMLDNSGQHSGIYLQKGDNLALSFFNGTCGYQGKILGQTLTGFGQTIKGRWNFSVTRKGSPIYRGGNLLPVEMVSWEDCQTFIAKLRSMDNKSYRLPTEAEWEYSCRAGTTTPFYFGQAISMGQANCKGSGPMGTSLEKTTPAGIFPGNDFNLRDMHGNVWQWCEDWYGDYPQGNLVDPRGPGTGTNRVLRGGSCFNDAAACRSARRNWEIPEKRFNDVGFRVCFSPE